MNRRLPKKTTQEIDLSWDSSYFFSSDYGVDSIGGNEIRGSEENGEEVEEVISTMSRASEVVGSGRGVGGKLCSHILGDMCHFGHNFDCNFIF
ncbi:hypothetical protein BUALT_Bualt03G0148100 [Buddleja alternifolia]|uniref:Uncharacterized protein n=1 Tax=Buddleja alternifolia TaxID=168488 RepID=A0AAV6Y292_9LAMI|nr:hypothetical protein BUALT_Bualt03G0148100 [Buddleja alternifolia]